MSNERYTVVLGDRRYAIHRKWAKPAEGFGFLSDLMVDQDGRVHVAHRGTDQPVLVFDRDGRQIGSWGAGTLAEPHYINAAPDGPMAANTVTVGIAGGSQPHNNMQPYLGMNYIIAIEGIYPSRN